MVLQLLAADTTTALLDFCASSTITKTYNPILLDLQAGYDNLADTVMCSTSCNCEKINSTLWVAAGYDIGSNSFTGVLSDVTSCVSTDVKALSYYSMISELELTYQCSGICSPKKFWLFSSVAE